MCVELKNSSLAHIFKKRILYLIRDSLHISPELSETIHPKQITLKTEYCT